MIFVVCGPGGVGKGTLVKRLMGEVPGLWLSRSWTTRAPREGESPEAYYFAGRAEFEAKIEAGGFLEWASFLGELYGTPLPEAPFGLDLVLEIDVQGAQQVRRVEPDAIVVLLLAPSPATQAARLRSRGDGDDHVERRIKLAGEEERLGRSLANFVLVNDDLERAAKDLAVIVATCREKRVSG